MSCVILIAHYVMNVVFLMYDYTNSDSFSLAVCISFVILIKYQKNPKYSLELNA